MSKNVDKEKILEEISSEKDVDEDEVKKLEETIEKVIGDCLERIEKITFKEAIQGKETLTKKDLEGQEPEEFTRKYIINPILKELGYDPRRSEFSGKISGDTPDYKFETDKGPLLLEAKSIGKISIGEKEMKNYLNRKDLNADYGIASDGVTWTLMKWKDNEVSSITIELNALFLNLLGQKTLKKKKSVKDLLTTLKKDLVFEKADKATKQLREKKKEITKDFFNQYMKLVFGKDDTYSLQEAVEPAANSEEKNIKLFSISFMNKLIFLKFLEDKEIVKPYLLEDIWERYQESNSLGTFYKDTLEPLFFRVMNTPEDSRNHRIKSDKMLSSVPYLNGGLFRPSIPNEMSYDIKNDIIEAIMEKLIKKYSFTVKGKEESLDPSVLGKVFEKTINYLTSEEEKDEQKEKGAYYTPDDVTTYISSHSLRSYLYDKIKEELTEKYGYTTKEFENLYEDFEEILIDNPPKKPVMRKIYKEVIEDLKILDPACGSGHFLTSAMEELYWIRKSFCDRFEIEYKDDQQLIEDIIKNNVYGVDIEESAVEIAKLRLWLSILDKSELKKEEIDKLPNIEYNIRSGNSLIGFIDELGKESTIINHNLQSKLRKYWENIDKYRKGEIENPKEIKKGIETLNSNMNQNLDKWLAEKLEVQIEDSFKTKERFKEILGRINPNESKKISIIKDTDKNEEWSDFEKKILKDLGFRTWKYKATQTITKDELKVKASKKKLLENFKELFKKVEFEKASIKRPVWKEDIEEVGSFHWIMEFEEVLEQGGFDLVIGNPPYGEGVLSDKEKSLMENWKSAGCGDICGYFLEREIELVKEGGYVSNIIADSLAVNNSMTPVRDLMREKGNFELVFFGTRPSKIFDTVEERVCITTGKIGEGNDIRTSKNIRFTKEMREKLFDDLQYESTNGLILGSKIGEREDGEDTRLPKIGNEKTKKILEILKDQDSTISDLIENEGSSLDLRVSAGYWINALKNFPYNNSKIWEITFENEIKRDLALITLNSSLFYLYWSVYANNRDVFSNLVKAFPMPDNLEKHKEKIKQKSKEINECMSNCFNPNTGRTGEFKTENCKEKIDEIDELLGNLYGFSDELVEYIKSYDDHLRNKE